MAQIMMHGSIMCNSCWRKINWETKNRSTPSPSTIATQDEKNYWKKVHKNTQNVITWKILMEIIYIILQELTHFKRLEIN
jgi:hypothetical protein